MTDLTSIGVQAATMTSREIADLVGSRHDNVRVTIERLAERGVIALPAMQEKPTAGRPTQEYVFTGDQGKRDSIIVVAQLCPEFTAQLVDRWQELEQQASRPLTAAERRLADLEARPEPAAYAVGDRFVARFPSLNKRCSVDEYREQLARPEYDRGDRCAHWSDDLCVVEKVLHLSRGEFSHLCNNLLEDRTDLSQGGSGSDADVHPENGEFWRLTDAQRDAWIAKSWRAVTVVTCDGCRPLVIDPQGYRYARYVGFYPTPVEAPKPLAKVIPFRTPATVH